MGCINAKTSGHSLLKQNYKAYDFHLKKQSQTHSEDHTQCNIEIFDDDGGSDKSDLKEAEVLRNEYIYLYRSRNKNTGG